MRATPNVLVSEGLPGETRGFVSRATMRVIVRRATVALVAVKIQGRTERRVTAPVRRLPAHQAPSNQSDHAVCQDHRHFGHR